MLEIDRLSQISSYQLPLVLLTPQHVLVLECQPECQPSNSKLLDTTYSNQLHSQGKHLLHQRVALHKNSLVELLEDPDPQRAAFQSDLI